MDRDSDVDIMDGEEGEYRDVEIREQDRYLPIANIARIMKKVLPNNAKIAKEAKESIQECVSEFISFITSEASDKCQQEKRKTINGDDLLWAMSTLGFDKYVDPLKVYLAKYRESVRGERPEKKAPGRKDMSAQPKMTNAPPPMTSYSFDSSVISYISNDHTTPLMAPGKTEPLPPPPIMRQNYDSHSQQSNDLPSLQLS